MHQSFVESGYGNRQQTQSYGKNGDIPEGYSRMLVLRPQDRS